VFLVFVIFVMNYVKIKLYDFGSTYVMYCTRDCYLVY
jgi:hypothetical protein